MKLATLRLKKQEDRRLRAGHLWVYSNEVDVAKTPLANFEAGESIVIEASDGKPLGMGYVNPHSLICARLMSRDSTHRLNKAFFIARIKEALHIRSALFSLPYYRLVFGEGDLLPGLVVDRYKEILVVQITTAGMERVKHEIVAALQEVLQPESILLRNDSAIRDLEGLSLYVETALGVPQDRVFLEENGVHFQT